MQLSKIQQQAVEYVNGPCIVSAGAGSGKTRVITHKFAHLVHNYGINPHSILCITFTNKAAEELKNRLYELIGIENPYWVRTIHSACLQMIKPFITELGYKDNFTITSMSKQKSIIREILYKLNIEQKGNVGKMLTMISRCKDYPNPTKYLMEHYSNVDRAKHIFIEYHAMMQENNFLDFDDILLHAHYLFKHNEHFRQGWLNTFNYILVDEYQDVNNIQYLIIKELGNNITVVGDDYQAIYAFRGSDPKHFIEFAKNYENATAFKLEQNYRSVAPIVTLSQDIIAKNKNQIHKTCFSNIEGTITPKIVHFKNEYKEIDAIVKTCKKYIKNEYNLNEIAILYRIKMSSRIIEQEFNRHNIPYKIVNDISYFERKEIKDLMAYILFLYNFNDKLSFERLLQYPKKGIGKKTIEMIYETQGDTLIDKISNSLRIYNNKSFIALNKVMKMFMEAHELDFKDVLQFFIKEIKYYEYIESYSEEHDLDDRIMNINELINMTQKYDTIESFLEECSLINPDDHIEEKEQVTLMTIHAAKGLEFSVVFVIGLEEGTLPHYRAIEEMKSDPKNQNIDEERRLFYVACTRASRVLNISRCLERGWMKNLKPSRFLSEINEDLYQDFNMIES